MNEIVDFDEERWWDWEHDSSFEEDMKEARFRRIAEYVLDYC
jgi:hypothetical protein